MVGIASAQGFKLNRYPLDTESLPRTATLLPFPGMTEGMRANLKP